MCAIIFRVEAHYPLFPRLYDFLNWRRTRWTTILTTFGSLELMMERREANTFVKLTDADWAFMIAFAKSPLPLIKFSSNNSSVTPIIFATFTLFTMPLIDFLRSSHCWRWKVSPSAWACYCWSLNCLSLKGGIYTPPAWVLPLCIITAAGFDTSYSYGFCFCSSKTMASSCWIACLSSFLF